MTPAPGDEDAAAPVPAGATSAPRGVLVIGHRRVMVLLVVAWVLIVAANVISRWIGWTIELTPLRAQVLFIFATGGEAMLGTWFTIVMMLGIALLAVLIASAERATGSRWWRHWCGVAAVFVATSIDEQAQLHEALVLPMQRLFGITTGPLMLAWVIPALVLAAAVSLVFLRFVVGLPWRTRTWLVASIGLWLLGAVGMELVDGATFQLLQALGDETELRAKESLYAVEEAIEMLGIMMIVSTLLVHARDAASTAPGMILRVEA